MTNTITERTLRVMPRIGFNELRSGVLLKKARIDYIETSSADALVLMAERSLQFAGSDVSRSDRYPVILHVEKFNDAQPMLAVPESRFKQNRVGCAMLEHQNQNLGEARGFQHV